MFKDFLIEEYGGMLKKFFKTIAIHSIPYCVAFLTFNIIFSTFGLLEKIALSLITGWGFDSIFTIVILLVREKYERWKLLKRIEERIHK